ncbi:MAG TPA: hypothetical protein VNJ04_12490 [Gemmatimonadaceae bacterium]|nr:hypothetical protein [Gemmatimonadaceae bacterium]
MPSCPELTAPGGARARLSTAGGRQSHAEDAEAENVQDEMGCAIYLAQRGEKHASAKPLQDWDQAEVVSDHRGDTFRSVSTVRFADRVFVLYAFQVDRGASRASSALAGALLLPLSRWPGPILARQV